MADKKQSQSRPSTTTKRGTNAVIRSSSVGGSYKNVNNFRGPRSRGSATMKKSVSTPGGGRTSQGPVVSQPQAFRGSKVSPSQFERVKLRKNVMNAQAKGIKSARNDKIQSGNDNTTRKLVGKRVVPLSNQKQRTPPKMIPNKVVNPPGGELKESPARGLDRIFPKLPKSHKENVTSSNSSSGTSSVESAEDEKDPRHARRFITYHVEHDSISIPSLVLRNQDLSLITESDTQLHMPIECWRCGSSAVVKVVGEPTKTTHLVSFLLCVTCLTPCMYLPYWLDCSTTPTKRCSRCGAYLTEPPPRY